APGPGPPGLEQRARKNPEPGWVVPPVLPGEPVEEEAGDAQSLEASRLHPRPAIGEPAADDDGPRSSRRGGEQSRDVVRIVLAIAVQGDDTLGAKRASLRESHGERRALSSPARRAQDASARRSRRRRAAVGGTAVPRHDATVGESPRHDVRDGRRLVEDGDDGDVIAHAASPMIRAARQPPRAMPCTSAGPPPSRAASAPAATRSAPRPPCCPKRGASDTGSRMPSSASSVSSQWSRAGSPWAEP